MSGARCHVGGEDVVEVAVEVSTGLVIAHRGARIGMPRGDLDVTQVYPASSMVVPKVCLQVALAIPSAGGWPDAGESRVSAAHPVTVLLIVGLVAAAAGSSWSGCRLGLFAICCASYHNLANFSVNYPGSARRRLILMSDSNKHNLIYFEGPSMRSLYNHMEEWQRTNNRRLLSISIQQEAGSYCCIALTNPTEVVITSEDGRYHAEVSEIIRYSRGIEHTGRYALATEEQSPPPPIRR